MRMTMAVAATLAVLGVHAQAQGLQPIAPPPDFDKVAIKTTDLGNGIYMLEGEGDTTVYFPDANVLVAGDLVFFGRYPNIDFAYGGSIDGMIRGVDALIAFAKDDTKIVPGHGPAGTKAMMRDYRTMLAAARERIAKLKAAGKTEEEVVALKPTADYDAKFGVNERAIGNFLRVVYRSLPR